MGDNGNGNGSAALRLIRDPAARTLVCIIMAVMAVGGGVVVIRSEIETNRTANAETRASAEKRDDEMGLTIKKMAEDAADSRETLIKIQVNTDTLTALAQGYATTLGLQGDRIRALELEVATLRAKIKIE